MARSKASTEHDYIAKSTGAKVENALCETDAFDLKVSFRRAVFLSTPLLTLYCNYRPSGYSNLTFGVPLVCLKTNEGNIPKVMKMCIEEVEKRGLNVDKIYSVSLSRLVFGFTLNCRSRTLCATQKYGRSVECTVVTNLQVDMSSIQLARRFEREQSFWFTSTDNIHSVAALLKVS